MAKTTGIGWCDATFNPWVGCSKVSPGCLGAHCYAETLVTGRMGRAGAWGAGGTRERTSAANWAKPLRWDKLAAAGKLPDGTVNWDGHRPRVFCSSLADVFEERPELDQWRIDLLQLIARTPHLDWLLLTKRPEYARDALRSWYETHPFPEEMFAPPARWTSRDGLGWGVLPNVWVGVSIENARHTWRADVLREIPAAVRFISAEPLLSSLYPMVGSEDGNRGRSNDPCPIHGRDAYRGRGGAGLAAPEDHGKLDHWSGSSVQGDAGGYGPVSEGGIPSGSGDDRRSQIHRPSASCGLDGGESQDDPAGLGDQSRGRSEGQQPAVEPGRDDESGEHDPRSARSGSVPKQTTRETVGSGRASDPIGTCGRVDDTGGGGAAVRDQHDHGGEDKAARLVGVARGRAALDLTGIDLVIVGGESGGRDARPMQPQWAREIRDAVLTPCSRCGGTGTLWNTEALGANDCPVCACGQRLRPALFFKQWGSHDADGVYRGSAPTSGGKMLDGVEWSEMPEPNAGVTDTGRSRLL